MNTTHPRTQRTAEVSGKQLAETKWTKGRGDKKD